MGILSGFVVLFGLLVGKRLDNWTALFLATTVATSVTGFLFPFHHFLPSHAVGIISLVVLSLTIYSRYARRLAGAWRKVYVVGAMASLCLNVLVAIVQAFQKLAALRALAPTQSEPPFKLTQLVVLALFVIDADGLIHWSCVSPAGVNPGAQGRFWEMHDLLFENQDALEDENIAQYAEALGLDARPLMGEVQAGVHTARVREDFRSGARGGVNGTPTLFVNGVRYEGALDATTLLDSLLAPD
ncbi:MAG: DsbA family protein [Limisphaerales bacterium]